MTSKRAFSRAVGGLPSARPFIFPLVFAIVLAACGARAPLLKYENGVVRAEGWSGPPPVGGWESVLVVRAGDDPAAPAMVGDYKQSAGVITFVPRFAPTPGVQLHVSFNPGGRPAVTALFGEAAKPTAPTTMVAHIYPSASEWPANTLRMYVEFSAPMATGDAYTLIRVLDDQGRAIEKPFVEIEPELWDPAGKRLTILFDPGRIKRGLVDNETSGPPLMPGRTVTIEVDPALRDASGASLKEKFSRTIRVADAARLPVDVKMWRVEPPRSSAHDLVLVFPRPLDHALAQRAIIVMRGGSPVAGKVTLEENETRFRFTPASPWSPGRYAVRVNGVIEDLAGNRLGKLFDVDTLDPGQSSTATPFAEIAFEVPGG
jgi:hypothetical protein